MVCLVPPPPAPTARRFCALLDGGPSRPLEIGMGCRSGGPLLPFVLCWAPALQELAGGPLLVLGVPLAGGSPAGPLGPPPCSLAARHGIGLLGGGSPTPFPPSLTPRVRRARLFGGDPLFCRPVCWVCLLVRSPWGFVPPLLPLCVSFGRCRPLSDCASFQCSRSRADGLCCQVPRAVVSLLLGRRRSRGDWASYRRGRSRAGEVCFRVPRAAGSLLRPRLCLRVLLPCSASSRRAVSVIRWAVPGGSGGGWVFIPSLPPASVLPQMGLGRCEGSQDFNSLGAPILSGGQVIP